MASFLESVVGAVVPGMTAGVRTALPFIAQLSLQGSALSGGVIEALGVGGIVPDLPSLSANTIITQLRGAGFSMRRQIALKAIKAFKAQAQAHQFISDLPNYIVPPASRIPFAAGNQLYPYHITVAVTGRDQLTGELRVQYVTITDTNLMTKARAQAEAVMAVQAGEHYQITDIQSASVTMYTKQQPGQI